MRLLHTLSLEFEQFFDTEIPPYAILSHRWGKKEVSHHEMRKRRASEGPGLLKILGFCELALRLGYEWVWIDTCCIDQKSSAELSEAINSMYKWYHDAEECFVYLADVKLGGRPRGLDDSDKTDEDVDFGAMFSASSWFTRGWTIQELLAPHVVRFYDVDWREIGTQDDLAARISAATYIHRAYITKNHSISQASVATKMSWAARRKTSRSEDIAYCLLGLFGVNMPLLYGEGAQKAFIRLQTEIITQSDDETIFAWKADMPTSGMLATGPSFFADSGSINRRPVFGQHQVRYWMTNKGLAFQIPDSEWPASVSHEPGTELSVILYTGTNVNENLSIRVRRINSRNTWCRISCHSLTKVPERNDTSLEAQDPQHVIYVEAYRYLEDYRSHLVSTRY